MALVIGNLSNTVSTPSGNTQTFTHNTGASGQTDSWLFISLSMQNSRTYTGATYDGVAMTKITGANHGALSKTTAVYALQNPSSGSNNIVVSFSGSQWNGSSIGAFTFSGCGGAGNSGVSGLSGSPHSENITIASGSSILAGALSNAAFGAVTIDLIPQNKLYQHNINSQSTAVISAPFASAGTKAVSFTSGGSSSTQIRVEILASSAGPVPTRNRIHIT